MKRNDFITLDNLGLEARKMRANLRTRDELAARFPRSSRSQQAVRLGLGSVLAYGVIKAFASK